MASVAMATVETSKTPVLQCTSFTLSNTKRSFYRCGRVGGKLPTVARPGGKLKPVQEGSQLRSRLINTVNEKKKHVDAE